MEETVKLSELLKILKKRMALLAISLLTGIIVAVLVTVFLLTPKYQASAQLLVNRAREGNPNVQWNEIQTDIQMINTYKTIIKGPVILNEVRERLGTELTAEELSKKIEIVTEQNSQVFSIKVLEDNPYTATDTANTISTVFKEKIGGIMSVENVTIISDAALNAKQVSPKMLVNVIVGGIIGLLIGIGVSFLLEFMDKTVRDEQYIKELLGWTSLGSITEMNENEVRNSVPKPVTQTMHRNSRNRV